MVREIATKQFMDDVPLQWSHVFSDMVSAAIMKKDP